MSISSDFLDPSKHLVPRPFMEFHERVIPRKKLKGVVLAGGSGTRLGMITRVVNKHCCLVYKKPMLVHALNNVRECGITDTMIVTSEMSGGLIMQLVGDGSEFGLNVTYRMQDEPLGIAHALALAEEFAGDDPIMVMLGDNFLHPSPRDFVTSWSGVGAKILTTVTDSPEEFGIVRVASGAYKCRGDGTVEIGDAVYDNIDAFLYKHHAVEVVEKPKDYVGNLMVTGVYMYDHSVWNIIRNLSPSGRGEYEISSVNTEYLNQEELAFGVFNGHWLDCGNPDSLLDAANYAREHGIG